MKLGTLLDAGFDIQTQNHAEAVLLNDFAEPLRELCEILSGFRIKDTELIQGGGGEANSTQRLRRAFASRGWKKRNIVISKTVDGKPMSGSTHEIDHVRGTENGSIALEIEWNNKDPFFDRDLENFQRLHAEGAISAGIVVTRGKSLQKNMVQNVVRWGLHNNVSGFDDLQKLGVIPTARQRRIIESADGNFLENWAKTFAADKFGSATTHWDKLKIRLDRGVGNPCPLLLVGIPQAAISTSSPS